MVIAIDGPGGVGKSTVARRLADRLGLPHLDTGATYRAATLRVLRSGVDPSDGAAVVEALEGMDLRIDDGTVVLDGEDVTDAIRAPEVTAAVSTVAAHPEVRSRIVALQRRWVADHGGAAVVEGRDIGTVVFPDAAVKVFLTARPEVRAARRARDAEAAGKDPGEVAAELAERDRKDAGRRVSPMRPAPDAVVVDTSDLGIDEVVAQVLELVESAQARSERAEEASQFRSSSTGPRRP